MNRWKYTIIGVLCGIFFAWFGYISIQNMFLLGFIFILPIIPILKLLNWDSAVGFYHSGYPVDHFGMVKIVLIEAIILGLLGWCFDIIKNRKITPQ